MSEELLLLKISNIFSALQFEISSDDINVLSDSLFQVFDSGYVINYTDSYRIAHSLLDGIQASIFPERERFKSRHKKTSENSRRMAQCISTPNIRLQIGA